MVRGRGQRGVGVSWSRPPGGHLPEYIYGSGVGGHLVGDIGGWWDLENFSKKCATKVFLLGCDVLCIYERGGVCERRESRVRELSQSKR